MAHKSPITCHVLDQTTGKPAAGIPVSLTLLIPDLSPSEPFTATTDADGRVTAWSDLPGPSIAELIASATLPESSAAGAGAGKASIERQLTWSLKFGTGEYWAKKGVETFFPEVEIKFFVKGFVEEGPDGGKAPHYHVPLLMGPWSYTTYRGS